jgi:D-inositol-3-phosphate glycosyltransferase
MRRENNPYYEYRPRILIVGDAVAATGFARVMHSIFEHLKDKYEIHHLGINYHGDSHDTTWKIYPAKSGGDLQGVSRLVPLVRELNPQLVFILNDIWVLGSYMKQLRDMETKPKIIMYCPIDAGPLAPEYVEPLEGVDRFVVYTQFAKHEIEKAISELRQTKPGFAFPPIEVIAHGINTEQFYPLSRGKEGEPDPESRRKAIAALYGDDPEFRDAFIVLNANRNQPRKRIDITIKGFALFAENKPANVKLHLHMGVEDVGWNVIQLAKRYRIYDRLILTHNDNNLPSVPVRQLNEIYNASAVGINTSVGEGWGLVGFEHAATGAAQIVPRHSGCEELWKGSALMMDPVMSLTTEKILTEGKIVSPGNLAECLEQLYQDPVLLKEMSGAAYRNALKPEYRWDHIAQKWHELFQNVFDKMSSTTYFLGRRELRSRVGKELLLRGI